MDTILYTSASWSENQKPMLFLKKPRLFLATQKKEGKWPSRYIYIYGDLSKIMMVMKKVAPHMLSFGLGRLNDLIRDPNL